MKRKIMKVGSIFLCSLLMVACGEGSSNSANKTNAESTTIAKDNLTNKVVLQKSIYRVEVHTDREEPIEKLSRTTKSIYGDINGERVVLSINNNYEDGDVFVVKVFENDELVAQSDEVVLDGDDVEFDEIEVGGEG